MRGGNLVPTPNNHFGCTKLRDAPTSTEANLRGRQPKRRAFLPETGLLLGKNWALVSIHRVGCMDSEHAAVAGKIRTKILFNTPFCNVVICNSKSTPQTVKFVLQ